ncbi:MFS transporter [Kineosporia succinea]
MKGAAVPTRPHLDLVRWQAGLGTFAVPQAAAPIAFALLARPLTGSARSGAALVFAMTLSLVLFGVPVTRLGRRFDSVAYLRGLLVIRTTALVCLTGSASLRAPFVTLIAPVVVVGAVNGAAYAYQRALLNHLVAPGARPRAVGVATTLNEVAFASSPVLASTLGAVSPVGAMAVITLVGAGPLVLTPRVRASAPSAPVRGTGAGRIPAQALVWLCCAAAGSAVVSSVEVGAVSFALGFGLDAGWAFVFATTLCLGSVTGGIWVSVRNRVPGTGRVIGLLTVTAVAAGVLLVSGHVVVSLLGAATIGFVLPGLGTFYSLRLDELAPPGRGPEMFAFLRMANAAGIIVVSGLLAALGLRSAVLGGLVLLLPALGAAVAVRLGERVPGAA